MDLNAAVSRRFVTKCTFNVAYITLCFAISLGLLLFCAYKAKHLCGAASSMAATPAQHNFTQVSLRRA
jgi:hypothetical protein